MAVAQTEYPSNWPKLLLGSSGTCLSLSGTYHYVGEADRADRNGVATIDRAAFNRMSVRGRPLSATFDHDVMTGALKIHIDGQDISPPDRADFSRKLACEDGWSVNLREVREPGGNATLGYVTYAQVRLLYTRAEDKSLIVHFTSEMEAQRSLLGSSTRQDVDAWYRFAVEAPNK